MIGLREDQQMKARIIDYLNNATAPCRRWLASDDGGPANEPQTDTALSLASQLLQGTAVGFKPVVGSVASKAAG